ncbi:hypothetical protein JUN65_18980, partial [Gluconacetobacter azotocaptans]|uniref:hypothetical protein n=1 Tax=Gluconacetobacter azotocaptans TaxID=142834 RepID=UPI00195A1AAB
TQITPDRQNAANISLPNSLILLSKTSTEGAVPFGEAAFTGTGGGCQHTVSPAKNRYFRRKTAIPAPYPPGGPKE